MNLNELATRCHKANEKWWMDLETGKLIVRDRSELIALIISELSEALEGERKGLMDDHLTYRKMAEVEMADALIRLLDYAGGFGVDLNEWPFGCSLPDKKGAAIFKIMESVVKIQSGHPSSFINLSIAQIQTYCEKFEYNLWGAFEEKMAYNARRYDHSHVGRLQEGGKKF